jgi:predicted Zn-dependent peptidase
VVGDVAAGEVFALADKYFGALAPRPDIPPAPDGRTVPASGVPVIETVIADVPAPRLYLAHRTYPFGGASYDAVTVLATVLGGGRGSRLYQRLADGARLAQPDTVGAYGVDLAHAPAPLIVTATARPGVTAADLEAGLVEVVDELAAGGVTEAELDRARALLTTSWWRQMSTVDGRADTLGRYALQFGDPARAADQLPGRLAVTAEQVAEVAAQVLRPQDRVTLTYLAEVAA